MYISNIEYYLPSKFESNFKLQKKFKVSKKFINQKIGIKKRFFLSENLKSSDMCIEAFKKLEKKNHNLNQKIDCIVVITQNPDFQIPHTSAVVHSKLNLSDKVACFDLSLGCSGYPYGLSIISSFMKLNKFKKGLLFTSDPYSKIIDKNDKNTRLIFSDAATVTLIERKKKNQPQYKIHSCDFKMKSKNYEAIIKKNNYGKLKMQTNLLLSFALNNVPLFLKNFMKKNKINYKHIDKFIFHQGSKYLLNQLVQKCDFPKNKVPTNLLNLGNTVSSSIPILLKKNLNKGSNFILCGFGVGLSYSACYLIKNDR